MKRSEIFVTAAVGLLGLGGAIYFGISSNTFMMVICILMALSAVLIGVVNLDREWGNPFDVFRTAPRNMKIRGSLKERAYLRVQNTITNGKVFVSVEDDGVYIRLAGDENKGEAYSDKKVKVYEYES